MCGRTFPLSCRQEELHQQAAAHGKFLLISWPRGQDHAEPRRGARRDADTESGSHRGRDGAVQRGHSARYLETASHKAEIAEQPQRSPWLLSLPWPVTFVRGLFQRQGPHGPADNGSPLSAALAFTGGPQTSTCRPCSTRCYGAGPQHSACSVPLPNPYFLPRACPHSLAPVRERCRWR